MQPATPFAYLSNEGLKAVKFRRWDLAPPDLKARLHRAKMTLLCKEVADIYGVSPQDVPDLPFQGVADIFGYRDLVQALERT